MLLRAPRSLFAIAILAALSACASTPPIAPDRQIAGKTPSGSALDAFRDRIVAKRAKVAEFEFLKNWADRHGFRVWIAGGSAAGFAHYVKADEAREALAREGKPSPYLDSRFKYKYYQIFRSTQDADVVIDANEVEAAALEQALKERFDYLQGSKSAWEVRLLRHPRGSGAGLKEPLVDNLNFLNQNSDSHSTGMIELTDPPSGESAVRDLFDWDNHRSPPFLKDVWEGKLHFYSNALHATTSRAKAGLNPPILSVIRYFTKAFQYGLEIREEDRAVIEKIIAEFDPDDPGLASARNQIENNAKKLYGHAEDLEKAYRTLEGFGLRKKLVAFSKRHSSGKPVFLDRVPLLSEAFATEGRTAAEIFGSGKPIVVSHETNDILAYESITRSRRGLPNVLISRDEVKGEAALYGDGFYTKVGREGARETGLTIRFELNPQAREGRDFLWIEKLSFVVVRNKRALRVIDESVEMTPANFFRFLAEAKVDKADLGLWKMMATVIQTDLSGLSRPERLTIADLTIAAIKAGGDPGWIMNFLLPVPALRADLKRRILALPLEERGELGLSFWKFSSPAEYDDPLLGPAIKPWRDFLSECDVFGASRDLIGPTLEGILATTINPKSYVYPPLLPNDCYRRDKAALRLLQYAEMLDGPHALKSRIAALDFDRKAKLLHLINASLSSGHPFGQRIPTHKSHYLYEWLRDSFLADPTRPADFYKTWDLSEIPTSLYDVRLRIGPVSPSEMTGLLSEKLHRWGDMLAVKNALVETIEIGNPRSIESASAIALRLAESGNMHETEQRPIFLQTLIDHADRIRGTPTHFQLKAKVQDMVLTVIRENAEAGNYISDTEMSFLARTLANPDFHSEANWDAFMKALRVSEDMSWKRLLGSILILGHDTNPHLAKREDLVEICIENGYFSFAGEPVPVEARTRAFETFARDYHTMIGEKIRQGALFSDHLLAMKWRATCGDLLR